MELRQLKYFVAVVSSRSFSAAAEILHIAQPALSRQILALEDELGVQLLIRKARGVQPTSSGLRLFEHAQKINAHIASLKFELVAPREGVTGHVTLGLPPSLSFLLAGPLHTVVREKYPGLVLRVIEGLSVFIVEWLEVGRIDVAVLTSPSRSRAIEARGVFDEELVLVAAPEMVLGYEGVVRIEELRRFPLAVTHGFRVVLEPWLVIHRVELDYEMELDSIHVVLSMAMEGRLATIAPYSTAEPHISAGRLGFLRLEPAVKRIVALARSAKREVTPAIEAVEGLVLEELARLPTQLPSAQ